MVYAPGTTTLVCQHCGFVKQIPQSAEEIQEQPFEKFVCEGDVAERVLRGIEGERRCTGCGAVVMMNSSTVTDECPFCGTHLVNPITTPRPIIEPKAVLPFGITDMQARAQFKAWVKSRWFAPNKFKYAAELGRIAGLYVPFWTYDAMTWSFYTGQRGEHYYVTVGSGKNRRQERRTSWTPVSGNVNHFFNDVLVCASRSVPSELVRQLEPWGLNALQPFREDYLSGFRTERYQVGLADGYATARTIMDSEIEELVRRHIGGDEQRITEIRTQVDGVTFKHVLMPLWMSAYRLREKTYRVVINARTGEVSGERPWSYVKITLAVIAALAVVIPIVYAIVTRK
ncbi:hypothetical protein IT570_08850 [Candidatus Sumerlaeota bacterium]|nr:hypothetical protein [Candidatus Sumerlaeota bacterium]